MSFSQLWLGPQICMSPTKIYLPSVQSVENRTEKDVEIFFKSLQENELGKRIVIEPSACVIDGVFHVSQPAHPKEAVKDWSDLRFRCQWIMIAQGAVALVGLAVTLYQRWYLIIAGMVLTIASCILAGRVLVPYFTSDQQIQAWTKPEEEFLERRNAALSLSFSQILEKKCCYALDPKMGTLTELEVLILWKEYFKKFAETLLTLTTDTARETKWLHLFATNNPLSSEFFGNSSALVNAKGWELVKQYQKEMENIDLIKTSCIQIQQWLQQAKNVLIDGQQIQPTQLIPMNNTATTVPAPLPVPAQVRDNTASDSGDDEFFSEGDSGMETANEDSDSAIFENFPSEEES